MKSFLESWKIDEYRYVNFCDKQWNPGLDIKEKLVLPNNNINFFSSFNQIERGQNQRQKQSQIFNFEKIILSYQLLVIYLLFFEK